VAPILFGTKLSFLVLPGTVVVFIASWLYMDNPPPRDPTPVSASNEPQKLSLVGKLAAVMRVSLIYSRAFVTRPSLLTFGLLQLYKNTFLGTTTFFTILIVAFLTMSEAKLPDFAKGPSKAAPAETGADAGNIQSPFKNTMAMIRWNSAHPERIPLLMKYDNFFHTVHISMPGLMPEKHEEFHNITHDQWPGTFTVYMQLAHTMKLILDTQPEINGLMYFHFDAWVDPFAWAGFNPYNIHFPSIVDEAPPSSGGPHFTCISDTSKYNWWGWGQDFHRTAMAAAATLDNFGLNYKVNREEWCVGWSDIYYIPRRFFSDYIFLSEVFGALGVFHEVAVPTMVHIIEQSRRRNPFSPVMDRIGDCWGSCCASNPTKEDVLWARCGHRLNYLDQPVVDAFYNRLDDEAKLIGQQLNQTKYAMSNPDDLSRFDSATLSHLNGGNPKGIAPKKQADAIEEALAVKGDHRYDEQEKPDSEKAVKAPSANPVGDSSADSNKAADKAVNKDPNGALRDSPNPASGQKLARRALTDEVVAGVAGLGF
jgi:hypothetical protein